ncbi:MAG: class I SAM-dependent methyltransferase [Pseudomonadota bacterium]
MLEDKNTFVHLSKSVDTTKARLYRERIHALEAWPVGGVIAEVGVMQGAYTRPILERVKPETFWAIDKYEAHDNPKNPRLVARFEGKTQEAFYRDRFAAEIEAGQVQIKKGLSYECLAAFPADTFDAIYIDAAHDYASVKADAEASIPVLKRDGLLVFNDYAHASPAGQNYGILSVANQLLNSGEWELVYFALDWKGFPDLAMRRAP